MASIHAANLPSGARDSPVPNSASTTTSAPSSLSSSAISTPSIPSASLSSAAAPRSRLVSAQLTELSRPQRWRCRAAASPSPALLPTPQTTAVLPSQKRATCQPAASISHSTEMPNRSCARRSTSATCRLVSVGGALNDKGAVGVVTMDGICLGNGSAEQLGDEVRGDGADLRKLECRVAERAVVDGHLHPFGGLGLLGQGAGSPDPRDHSLQLLVELEPFEVSRDGPRMPGGHSLEHLVQSVRPTHLLDLLEDHRGDLAVALGEHGVRPFGQGEQERRAASAALLRAADHDTVPFQVRQVL